MKSKFTKYPEIRPSFADLKKTKTAMLMNDQPLPPEYYALNQPQDIRDHILKDDEDTRVARMTIIWDLPLSSLDDYLEDTLDRMQEAGAAFVLDAELVVSK